MLYATLQTSYASSTGCIITRIHLIWQTQFSLLGTSNLLLQYFDVLYQLFSARLQEHNYAYQQREFKDSSIPRNIPTGMLKYKEPNSLDCDLSTQYFFDLDKVERRIHAYILRKVLTDKITGMQSFGSNINNYRTRRCIYDDSQLKFCTRGFTDYMVHYYTRHQVSFHLKHKQEN